MARSFDIAYRYTAKDSYSPVSKKIRLGNKKLKRSFNGVETSIKKSDRQFKRSSGSFVSGMRRMAVAAVAFLGVRQLITKGTEFQDSLADLSAITGAVGKDLDLLRNKTLRMSKDFVTSQANVATAIKLVASAKPDLLDNLDALVATTKQVLLLKNAAGIELTDAANITAQSLNIFGKGADQAGKFVNILAAGAKLGSSEIRDTGEAMLIAGPGARAAGLSFLQLNAAIQTTAKGGIKGTRAGTALNAIFGRLQRAGIDFQKLGLQGSFEIIKNKMDSLTSSTARAQFAAKIFGEEHSKVGFALMDNVNFLSQYEKSLAGTNIAQEQADIRLATLSKRWDKLTFTIGNKFLVAFLKVEPAITSSITSLTQWLDTIDSGKTGVFGESLGIIFKGFKMVAKVATFVGGVIFDIYSTIFSGIGTIISSQFNFVISILKGVGTLIGQIAGAIATLDFGGFSNLFESFSVGGKFLGIFGGDESSPGSNIGAGGERSVTDVNVNLNAPEGTVQSASTKTRGRGANVGLNLVTP